MQSAKRILQTATAALERFAFMLSPQATLADSSVADDAAVDVPCTIQEVNMTVPDRNLEELDRIGLEWHIYQVSKGGI